MFSELLSVFNTVVSGSERYLAATRVGLELEQSYREYRQQAPRLAPAEQRKLLARTHQRGAEKITQLFHDNGAIWVKLGQFLSSRSDMLPAAYVRELERLQDDARPVSFRSINKVLQREWGRNWRQHFARFDEEPVAAASVAQVHRARLRSGDEVAVKVQLPQARRRFRQDSLVFKAVGLLGAPLISQFDLRQVLQQIIDMTMAELDFLLEESNHLRFGSMPHPGLIYVPRLFDSMSTSRVLVSEWVNGTKLTDYLDLNTDQAESLLKELLRCYVQQITVFGLYHADPHPGNFLVRPDGRVAVLDYGAIGSLTPAETEHYAELLQVLFGKRHSETPLGELFRKAGFVARDQKVFEAVADMVLKESLRNPEATDMLGLVLKRMQDLKVQIPDSFVSLARVILTFGGLLKMYRVKPDSLNSV